jgi:hypothetical protein
MNYYDRRRKSIMWFGVFATTFCLYAVVSALLELSWGYNIGFPSESLNGALIGLVFFPCLSYVGVKWIDFVKSFYER